MDWFDGISWSDADWGTVPAWVGSILTGGSLSLGFYILLRDRRKEEAEQASRLVVRSEYRRKQGYEVLVTNNAEQAFYDVGLTVYSVKRGRGRRSNDVPLMPSRTRRRHLARIRRAIRKGGRDDWPLRLEGSGESSRTLQPDATASGIVTLEYGGDQFMIVSARDATGRYWGFEPLSRYKFRFDDRAGRGG